MLTSFSRRTTAVALASLTVAAAAAVAALRTEETEPRTAVTPANGAAATVLDAERPVVRPRPGEVAVCRRPGREEIVRIPDPGAPDGGRPIWVRRPPGPDSADLPVLYLLHGSTGTHESITGAGAGPLLDREMCRTGVEFVVAAPYGQEVGGSDTEWGDAADGDFRIETFVTEKAVRAVEGDHPRPRHLRAIGGFSMGGYGAAALSLRHPDLYRQAISWAGYFRVDDPSGTFGDTPDPHAPDRLLDDPAVRDIRFLLVEGTEDFTPLQEGSIHGEARRFAALLTERGMAVQTRFPPGGHTYDVWTPTFPEAVDFLVTGWRQPVAGAAQR
ncbi:alpha/beta hydrolase [Marinitenerispora sediminis]|uniref:Esterase n=1 Tax=Marinitenerispora sediminis TaxID=1931232 RepID=A0A368T886_9ACTN|nr:alpha/beta hydrolase-fold protein [Marinitenerispora sediminis]RCV51096.1 esterase [Marinitenerispora sediminis]RCV56592.1 esterase [Marinitenerispora sediminis]RCV60091.1 esterase [Marinitenerispora sediminis]